ncbi:MAG: VWA domain-containing protein [Pseudomonadota bacterium]|nr:VWA domain-containing protein [Pseudomonadota bacterium]
MSALAQLHFLRPAWLLLLIPALLILWSLWRRQSAERAWRRVLAPHLLAHLLLRQEGGNSLWHPLTGLTLLWILGSLALAGPAWERAPSPFREDQAALVIALKVTPSMLAQDVQPSRLERAVHKIRDLLQLRAGGRTALIAYSGSAHLVMPLTRDARIIESFAAELDPAIMPLEGDAAAQAVGLANEHLNKAGAPGSILLIADTVSADQHVALQKQRDTGGVAVHLLAMAAGPDVIPPPDSPSAPALDRKAMDEAAFAAGGSLVLPTVDDGDVKQLSRLIERSLTRADAEEGDHWIDAGYYLVPVLALLVLLGFRRGWVVRYE